MFKIQTKQYSNGKRWQDIRGFGAKPHKTEAEAWRSVESWDQDGFRDTGNFRVVPDRNPSLTPDWYVVNIETGV